MKRLVAHPSDREAATRALVEGAGGKLLTYLVTTGDSDFLMLVESGDAHSLVGAVMVGAASGSVANLKTVQAFTSAEFVEIQKRAGRIAAS